MIPSKVTVMSIATGKNESEGGKSEAATATLSFIGGGSHEPASKRFNNEASKTLKLLSLDMRFFDASSQIGLESFRLSCIGLG
jgi:hypothetical protein